MSPTSRHLKKTRHRADICRVRGQHRFGEWLTEEGYSPRTTTLYRQTVTRASQFLAEHHTTLARATEVDLHAFWLTVPPTRSSRAGVRYALIAYYHSQGRVDGRPASSLPNVPAPYRLPRPATVDIYSQHLAAARDLGNHHQLIAEMLYFTGCRIGELRMAAWHQFDLAGTPEVWYIDGKGARRRGPKIRQIPLHPALASTLRTRRATSHSDFLFPSSRSREGVLSQSTLRGYVAEIAQAGGLEPLTPHRWRHSTATIALERTHDLRAVQEFLGHASLASTQIYTGVVAGRLHEIVMSLSD